jgi:antitoxin component of RelBE/YafQ-DinJ toxin-antitoxin module
MSKITISSKVDEGVKLILTENAEEKGLTLSNLVERILYKICKEKRFKEFFNF